MEPRNKRNTVTTSSRETNNADERTGEKFDTAITGDTLIGWGFYPGAGFSKLLEKAQRLAAQGANKAKILAALPTPKPPPEKLRLRTQPLAFSENIESVHPDDKTNVESVRETMTELMRNPMIDAGTIMPDACPAGPVGTIPVGGVAASRAIHPGMHSADICCSVMITEVEGVTAEKLLDAAHNTTHFGKIGKRGAPGRTSKSIYRAMAEQAVAPFSKNRFLSETRIQNLAKISMGTQGDGNHFLYVGRSRSTGRVAIVTHHGSRGPGAQLYNAGMREAVKYCKSAAPEVARSGVWLEPGSQIEADYWEALQIIRDWTKANHLSIHQSAIRDAGGRDVNNFWNEHNFVFKRNGLYFHGKGATPGWQNFATDATDLTLVPLNMAQPILITRGSDNPDALGFLPHGAGRNWSRTEHRRRLGNITPEAQLAKETQGLDIRFYSGKADVTELPSSYKDADAVVSQIKKFGLAEIEDYIDPHGCIMAGEFTNWQNRKRK